MWMAWAKAAYEHTGEKQRLFAELRYGARSWGKPRRVIARLEHGRPKGRKGGANPRYVVTNLQGRGQNSTMACTANARWRTASRSNSNRTSCPNGGPKFRLILALAYSLMETIPAGLGAPRWPRPAPSA